jgi:hypothetical protein
MSDAACADCGIDTVAIGDYYMVYDAIWADAGMADREGMLCLDCLVARLGRPLQFSDFPAFPINLKRSIQQVVNKSRGFRRGPAP